MTALTLFYDARCGLCSQVRRWLSRQPVYVRLDFVSYDSPEASRKLPGIRHLRADQEIVVMADSGEVWQGAGAWVVCLWALREYRPWSFRLAAPAMQGVARKIVHLVSHNRLKWSALLGLKADADLLGLPEPVPGPVSCRIPHDLDLID